MYAQISKSNLVSQNWLTVSNQFGFSQFAYLRITERFSKTSQCLAILHFLPEGDPAMWVDVVSRTRRS